MTGLENISAMTANTAMNNRTNVLQNKLDGDLTKASDEELKKVCKDFEAYFVEQVMKEVEKTIPKNEEQDASMAQLTDFYKEEMMKTLAKDICDKQDIGFAQQMYEQMKRNYS